jgi:flagellar basal-body rod protein FlgG
MYAALTGNIAAQQRLDVISSNLANVHTPGFKRDRMGFESVLQSVKNPSQSAAGPTAFPTHTGVTFSTDFTYGEQRQTGNTFDFSINGDGFFVVKTPEGQAYTRQGNFHLGEGDKLVNADGYEVMAGGNPITIKGGKLVVDERGGIYVDGNLTSTIDVVDFPKPYQLKKMGSAQFIPDAGVVAKPVTSTVVRQGFVEESNVNTMAEMAQLIEASRFYESCVKVVQNFDSVTGKAANELGKL